MIPKILWWLGLSIACAIAYHIAGKGGFKWAKLIRRLGCSLLALCLFLALKGFTLGFWWAYGLFIILNYGALSTYHDYIGYDCFWLTGLFYGLSALPLVWCGVHLLNILIRSIFLAISIGWIRSKSGKTFTEEFWSGFLYCASVPILLI